MSYVYAVIFEDGKMKAGKSGDIVARIKNHISDGRKFGLNTRCFFISYIGDAYNEEEKKLLKKCTSRFNLLIGEYFEGADFFSVKDLFSEMFDEFSCGSSIKKSNSGMPMIEVYFSALDDVNVIVHKKFINRVLNVIKNSGDKGVTLSILRNRFRTRPHDVVLACKKLEDSGAVTSKEHLHSRAGYAITTYTMR